MNLALIQTKTTVVRTYEAFLPSLSRPYRNSTKLEICIETVNGEYINHIINDRGGKATATELLEIGAEVLKILKEDEEAKKLNAQLVSIAQQSPITTAEDCPF